MAHVDAYHLSQVKKCWSNKLERSEYVRIMSDLKHLLSLSRESADTLQMHTLVELGQHAVTIFIQVSM
jgi:hypothetical protein